MKTFLIVSAMLLIACSGHDPKEHYGHMAQMYGLKVARGLPDTLGANLYGETCTKCHDLPDVKSHNAWQWEYVVDRMEWYIDKGEVEVDWNESVRTAITRFLMDNSNEEEAVLPSTPVVGAKLYKSECGACHPAPSPKTHSMQVWPNVIDKMQYIKSEFFSQRHISEESIDEIMAYLEANQ